MKALAQIVKHRRDVPGRAAPPSGRSHPHPLPYKTKRLSKAVENDSLDSPLFTLDILDSFDRLEDDGVFISAANEGDLQASSAGGLSNRGAQEGRRRKAAVSSSGAPSTSRKRSR